MLSPGPSGIHVERDVADAVVERLAVLRDRGPVAEAPLAFPIARRLARHRLAVDVEHAVEHLDLVAGQADHALDVVGARLARRAEHHDVAALRLAFPDAAVNEGEVDRERNSGCSRS